MDTAQKFFFNTDFEEEAKRVLLEIKQESETEAEALSEVAEVVPTFTEEEVNAARKEGFNQGKEEGIREAANATEQRVLETLNVLSQQTEQIFHGMDEVNVSAIRNAMSVGASIVQKLFPHLSVRHAGTEVEAFIETVINQVISNPKIRVHVNVDLFEAVNERFSAMIAGTGHGNKIDVIADSTIPEGNCKIEWESGGSSRDATSMWREIDAILERNLEGDWKALKEVADAIAEEKLAALVAAAEQSDDTNLEPAEEDQPEPEAPEVAPEEVPKAVLEEVIEEAAVETPIETQEEILESITKDTLEDTPGAETAETETPETDDSPITDDTPEGQGNENG